MDGVVSFGLPYDDQDRAKKFYESMFGWQITKIPDLDYYYLVVTTESDLEKMEPTKIGAINGGMLPRSHPDIKAFLVIGVKSLDDYLEKIVKLGGKVEMAKVAVGDYGFYAQISDTEGNRLGIWQATPEKVGRRRS